LLRQSMMSLSMHLKSLRDLILQKRKLLVKPCNKQGKIKLSMKDLMVHLSKPSMIFRLSTNRN